MEATQRILVIDDDDVICDLVSATAQAIGLQCTTTTAPTSFLKNLTPHTTLVLLDLMMPEVDGIELLRLLATRQCKAGIVLMSAACKRTIEATEQFARDLGLTIVCHLEKPFNITEL